MRLIVDEPRPGPWNMAVDEALLEAAAAGGSEPTLRLYSWDPPALSLGRSQPCASSCDRDYLARAGIDLVRRPSGGAAVLHEHERTYAVVGPLGREPFDGGLVAAFRRVAGALRAALGELGLEVSESAALPAPRDRTPVACFCAPARHEITWRGLKLVGSAQVRRRGALLQHGSIPLRADPRRLARAVGQAEPARGFTDLETALGAPPDRERLDRALRRAFERALGAPGAPGALSAAELRRAGVLAREKYACPEWTLRGRWTPGGS